MGREKHDSTRYTKASVLFITTGTVAFRGDLSLESVIKISHIVIIGNVTDIQIAEPQAEFV